MNRAEQVIGLRSGDLEALRAWVERDGVARVAVACDVSVMTVYRVLRGAVPSRSVRSRIERAVEGRRPAPESARTTRAESTGRRASES